MVTVGSGYDLGDDGGGHQSPDDVMSAVVPATDTMELTWPPILRKFENRLMVVTYVRSEVRSSEMLLPHSRRYHHSSRLFLGSRTINLPCG